MYQPLTFFIGLRYLRGRTSDRFARLVAWLSSIGMTLGVIAMIVILSVMNGFDQEQKNNFLRLIPQALITHPQGSLSVDNALIEQFSRNPSVNKVTPLTVGDVVLQSRQGLAIATMLGINIHDDDPLTHHLYFTQADVLTPGSYNVIIGDRLADQLRINLGDDIRLMATGAGQLTPMGRIPSQRLFSVKGFFSSGTEADTNQILVNQHDASRLMRYPRDHVTGLRLFLNDPFDVEQLSQTPLPKPLLWQDWRVKKGELFQAINMEKNMMGLLMSLIILVAIFNLITSLSLVVMDKQSEVAILQTLGLTRTKIMAIFMIQGASSGILGALIGTGLGIVFAANINLFMIPIVSLVLPVQIELSQVLTIMFATILLSLLSTLYPAWRAAAIQPAEALRYE